MNADVLTTTVGDGIAVITLGSARRIYFDEEMGDAHTEALVQGLVLERDLSLKLCITEPALARCVPMKRRTSPRRRARWAPGGSS